MEIALVRPNAHSLLPVLVQVHEHLSTTPSSQHAIPGNLSPSSYLNLLLDQVRLWHLDAAEIAMVVRVLDVYRHRFSAGWQGVGRAADMYRLGIVTEFIISRRVAYEASWLRAMEEQVPLVELPLQQRQRQKARGPLASWVMTLAEAYECRHHEVTSYLAARGLDAFEPRKTNPTHVK